LENGNLNIYKNDEETKWSPQYDLLASDKFAADFVVENELDGISYLRFGDNILGEMPLEGSVFKATYRIGNGRAGNVGTGAISRIAVKGGGINRVRNPLPASGGTDPEPIEQVRLYARRHSVPRNGLSPRQIMKRWRKSIPEFKKP